jgi:hypothetical protein
VEFKTWLRAEWDRVTGFALIILGAIVLYAGYDGVGNSAYVAEQLAYVVSGGLGGIFLLAVGATFLIRSDLHDHWRQLDRIETVIRDQAEGPVQGVGVNAVGSISVASNGQAQADPRSDQVESDQAGSAGSASSEDAAVSARGRRRPLQA